MNQDQLKALRPGNIVRHVGGGKSYVVTGNYGDHVTAVRSVDLANPSEWEVVSCDLEIADPGEGNRG